MISNFKIVVCDKEEWLVEFLQRVEASIINQAKKIGDSELDFVSNYIHNLDAFEWYDTLTSPNAFAYFNQSQITAWYQTIKFTDLFFHKGDILEIKNHSIYIEKNPHIIFSSILRSFKVGSIGRDSSKSQVLAQNDNAYLIHYRRIEEAMGLIERWFPVFYDLISTYLTTLIFVDKKASFRAATAYSARGMSYFRPLENWDVLTWAEELVHEASHNQINAILSFDPLISSKNAFELRVRGPIREDLRHHHGNFHALVVIARITQLNKILAEMGYEPKRLESRNQKLIKNSYLPFKVMEEEVAFTEVGKEIFQTEIRSIFS